MDPTKPILDLYSTFSSHQSKNIKPTREVILHQRSEQLQYNQLKQKYQDLYQSYSENISKLSQYEQELHYYREQKQQMRNQLEKAALKNDELNSTLLKKNIQLQQAYCRLQDQIKKPEARANRNQYSIDMLEDGIRETVNNNLNRLREVSLAQVRRLSNL